VHLKVYEALTLLLRNDEIPHVVRDDKLRCLSFAVEPEIVRVAVGVAVIGIEVVFETVSVTANAVTVTGVVISFTEVGTDLIEGCATGLHRPSTIRCRKSTAEVGASYPFPFELHPSCWPHDVTIQQALLSLANVIPAQAGIQCFHQPVRTIWP